MWNIFKTFLLLGCYSFGGPAAHIAYFRETFVQRLAWLSERQYAEFVALSQFLPGPGSSQVGFAIGYHRAGLKGAICAFLGFTLPSIMLVSILAISAGYLIDNSIFHSVIHGLKLLAVVVVLDAVLMMYKQFCKDKAHISLCLLSACALLVMPSVITQLLVLLLAALTGVVLFKMKEQEFTDKKTHCLILNPLRSLHYRPLSLFILLLCIIPFLASFTPLFSVFSDFFQAGSLVFGGGHVVLPLLQNIVAEQLTSDQFLTGYAIAQAVPGPMFTFATYIGYFMLPEMPLLGALVATLGVFLPGFLLLLACLKNWQRLAKIPCINAAISGVNAAVVGLLISALYQPVFISAVFDGLDMAIILVGVYLHKNLKFPIVYLVLLFAMIGLVLGYI
ncbi:chromate efflux transporter [Psychromonas sp. GE-S-Ul-11]|uniref:chromate efflux transporter n=1 Tax=Psychromonas sp. GE-S-Ul-11 TaxID=3241170 RepID=UPI00390CC5A6